MHLNCHDSSLLESFPSIKKIFLEQTCTHFLQQYPNSLSKSLHYSFVTALAEKYPTLKYLNKDDRLTGKTPYVSLFQQYSVDNAKISI